MGTATNDFIGGGRTCFRLFADGDADGFPPTSGTPYIVDVYSDATSSFFPDHAWKSLYRHPEGQAHRRSLKHQSRQVRGQFVDENVKVDVLARG